MSLAIPHEALISNSLPTNKFSTKFDSNAAYNTFYNIIDDMNF